MAGGRFFGTAKGKEQKGTLGGCTVRHGEVGKECEFRNICQVICLYNIIKKTCTQQS
mgnify:CR=1 FL=1